jgi:hypothetical protein
LAGRRETLRNDLDWLQAQLRGNTGDHPVQGFLEGLFGGLILGVALALFVARRAATVDPASLQEASIELKERATQIAQDARAEADMLVDQAGALTEQARAALDRLVPGDKTSEA